MKNFSLIPVLFLLMQITFAQVTVFPTNYSLSPYNGPWTEKEAAHLLHRTLFGARYEQIQTSITNGVNTTVDNLLLSNTFMPPLAYTSNEAIATLGTPWNNDVLPANNHSDTDKARKRSLAAWFVQNAMNDDETVQQKMFVFWHNHFGLSEIGVKDARTHYQYFDVLYSNSLGNTKTMVQLMSVNTAMLQFLNGDKNKGSKVNENYAREFLELYTLGKQTEVAPGDYTSYTEQDVLEGARVFSGWQVNGILSNTVATPSSIFDSSRHDSTPKIFSNRLDNMIIYGNGAQEYIDYIDTVFTSDLYGKYLCEKLYRYFVSPNISTEVENTIITGMQATLIANNYEIVPVLSQLFKSQHFYDVALRGSLMKNPLEFILSIYNKTGSKINYPFPENYKIAFKLNLILKEQGMNIFRPPSVAGWEPYYISPYGKLWVTGVYWIKRNEFVDRYVIGKGIKEGANKFQIDALGFLNGLDSPSDPSAVVDQMMRIFLPTETDNAINHKILKDILTDGLPDFEWTVQVDEYKADPTNPVVADPVINRIKETLGSLFKMYNFQTF